MKTQSDILLEAAYDKMVENQIEKARAEKLEEETLLKEQKSKTKKK